MPKLIRIVQLLFLVGFVFFHILPSNMAESALVNPFNRAIAIEEYLSGHELDPIEGIWLWSEDESTYGKQTFEVAIMKNTFDYKKYKAYEYIGITTDASGFVKEGQTKILLKKTGDRIYEGQFVFVVKDAVSKGIITRNVSVKVDKNGDYLSFVSPPVVLFGKDVHVVGKKLWPEKKAGSGADEPGTGSGFFVSKDVVATNAHVVKGYENKNIKVCFKDNEYDAKVIAKDEINDLALLKVNFNDFKAYQSVKPVFFGDVQDVVEGEDVFAIGYPLADTLGVSPKISMGIINSTCGDNGDPRLFQISVPIQPGNSGGPLFNEYGNVIGITSSRLNVIAYMQVRGYPNLDINIDIHVPQNVNFAIKANYLQNLALSVQDGPKFKQGTKDKVFKAKDIMANWRDSVVLITCE